MNLFSESAGAVQWVASVIRAFFRVRFWTTLALVLSITVERLAGLLAFFLPLKVILLAGSDGVPRYFRFFIDPADKMPWIIGLSGAAVGFYILSLLMEAASKRLSEAGSSEVLQGANEIAVASKQRQEAQGYYAQFSTIAANTLLVVIAFTALGMINSTLFLILAALILSQYLMTATVLQFGNPLNPGPTQRLIRNQLGGYLSILNSVNFLVAFLVILAPFLLGGGGNLLVAILSILLLRQALGALSAGISSTQALSMKRMQVDPLVFRDRQLQRRERRVTRNLRQVFEKRDREASIRNQLANSGMYPESVASEWRDSVVRGIYTFRIALHGLEGGPRYLLHQVFPQSQLHLLEHEAFLFEYMSRDRLLAPRVFARFVDGPFESQICDYGTGAACPANRWAEVSRTLMAHFWSVEPPDSLVRAFNTSKPKLEGRLTPEYLERIEVALDHPGEQAIYEKFISRLPFLKRVLSRVPVYICNPAIGRSSVAHFKDDDYRVMSWGRWTIEPIGAELLKSVDKKSLPSMLEAVREARPIGEDEELTPSHVMLVNQCRTLETDIAKVQYKKAIGGIRKILKSPLLADE